MRTGQEPLSHLPVNLNPKPEITHSHPYPPIKLQCHRFHPQSRCPHTNTSGPDGSNSTCVITNEPAKSVAPSTLLRLLKFGYQFSGKKMEALPQGDLSEPCIRTRFSRTWNVATFPSVQIDGLFEGKLSPAQLPRHHQRVSWSEAPPNVPKHAHRLWACDPPGSIWQQVF